MKIFKTIMPILIAVATGFQITNAAQVLAVLEILPKTNIEEEITIDEMRHLTDELRKQATMVLSKNGYSVLTRDNIIALIPPDEKEAQCLANSCAIDIGRAIGAEYVTQGSIGKFGKKLTISIELYESMNGKLLGSIVMESEDLEGLLTVIRKEAKALFSPLVSNPKKSSVPMWVAIALDVVGAGLVVYGIVKNNEIGNLQKDYNGYNVNNSLPDDFKATKKKMDDAKSMRNIMYISGGAVLGLGIGVHICF